MQRTIFQPKNKSALISRTPDVPWKTVNKDKILSKLQKSYNRLLKKLEERDNFIATTKYTENNAKKLDDMFANSSKIYQQLKAIEDELETEKKSGNIKGGRKESLSERGII